MLGFHGVQHSYKGWMDDSFQTLYIELRMSMTDESAL